MPKNKRKRKVAPEAASPLVAGAPGQALDRPDHDAPLQDVTVEPQPFPSDESSKRPAPEKACGACGIKLPSHARFCSACGEPQVEGLERPTYRCPPSSQEPATPRAAQAVIRSVARVAVPRSVGAAVIPSLGSDRPIPASLMQIPPPVPVDEETRDLDTRPLGDVPYPRVPPAGNPEAPAAHPSATQDPSPPSRVELQTATAQGPTTPGPTTQHATVAHDAANQAAFDASTEARILALRTSHEMTLERFERVMAGFRLKPKPKAKAVPAKSKDKAEKKADPKSKPSKGH